MLLVPSLSYFSSSTLFLFFSLFSKVKSVLDKYFKMFKIFHSKRWGKNGRETALAVAATAVQRSLEILRTACTHGTLNLKFSKLSNPEMGYWTLEEDTKANHPIWNQAPGEIARGKKWQQSSIKHQRQCYKQLQSSCSQNRSLAVSGSPYCDMAWNYGKWPSSLNVDISTKGASRGKASRFGHMSSGGCKMPSIRWQWG